MHEIIPLDKMFDLVVCFVQLKPFVSLRRGRGLLGKVGYHIDITVAAGRDGELGVKRDYLDAAVADIAAEFMVGAVGI